MLKLDVNVWLHSHYLELGTVKVLTASAGLCDSVVVSHSTALLGGLHSNRASFGTSQWLKMSSKGEFSQ